MRATKWRRRGGQRQLSAELTTPPALNHPLEFPAPRLQNYPMDITGRLHIPVEQTTTSLQDVRQKVRLARPRRLAKVFQINEPTGSLDHDCGQYA